MSARKHSITFFVILTAVTIALFLLWRNITPEQPALTADLVNKPLPAFTLPLLNSTDKQLTNQDFKGRVSILNIWASWCYACRAEHTHLVNIQKEYHVPMYAIDYSDNPASANEWLKKSGNPYTKIGVDPEGNMTDRLDIGGTPQTYIIDAKGIIRYRYLGAINETIWENELWPIIQQYQHEQTP